MYQNNELVYLLDLCILAYQLHSQTLIWPTDPYYERINERGSFMKKIHEQRQIFLTRNSVGDIPLYHGPGSFLGKDTTGWNSNPGLDPIVSNYQLIYPWRPGFTSDKKGNWIIYNTPKEITGIIEKVNMVRYSREAGPYAAEPEVKVDLIHDGHPDGREFASSLLYCFEGGTGSADDQKKPAAWSLMGFVLAENAGNDVKDYDVFIVFRGSRSGKLRYWDMATKSITGNPDWVTDLRTDGQIIPEISSEHECSTGNGLSMKRTLPTIIRCLTEIQNEKQKPPRAIYVAGHSLGGALAVHFTSAMFFGEKFGAEKPAELSEWPWGTMRLVTFGVPLVENEAFCKQFARSNIASSRVWLSGDRIVKVTTRKTVGQEYEIPHEDGSTSGIGIGESEYHSPDYIRRALIKDLQREKHDTVNVPANNVSTDGKTKNNEPWQRFDTFQEVSAFFKDKEKELGSGLEQFHTHLALFLDILDTYPGISQQDGGIPPLSRKILAGDFKTADLNFLLPGISQQIKTLDNNKAFKELGLSQYLKNCFYLAVLGKNQDVLKEEYSQYLDADF